MPAAASPSSGFAWPAAVIPVIRVAGRFPLADRGYVTTYLGPSHALHLHEDYRGTIRIGTREFSLRPGDLTLSPAGLPSAYDLKAPGHHCCVHFYPVTLTAGSVISLALHLPLHGAAPYVRERLIRLSRLHVRGSAVDSPDPIAAAAAAVALQDLLLWCSARAQMNESGNSREAAAMIEDVAAYLDAHLGESLSVRGIARRMGRSQNHLARRFRERFGMTILQYVAARRIEHARFLLESTDLPIKRIAARVGIGDPQYFNKQVRRRLGDSPSAVRAAARTSLPLLHSPAKPG